MLESSAEERRHRKRKWRFPQDFQVRWGVLDPWWAEKGKPEDFAVKRWPGLSREGVFTSISNLGQTDLRFRHDLLFFPKAGEREAKCRCLVRSALNIPASKPNRLWYLQGELLGSLRPLPPREAIIKILSFVFVDFIVYKWWAWFLSILGWFHRIHSSRSLSWPCKDALLFLVFSILASCIKEGLRKDRACCICSRRHVPVCW